MKKIVLFLVPFFVNSSFLIAQFNEKLEGEILAINAKNKLDNIERGMKSLDRLEEISLEIDSVEIVSYLLDDPWKYSHSVTNEGRKFRNSASIYMINFGRNSESFLITKKEKPKASLEWKYESKLFYMKSIFRR